MSVSSRNGRVAVPIGLATLGAALGIATGLSATDGTTSTTLTSVLAFAGGGVLSFFAVERRSPRKPKERDDEAAPTASVDLQRLGVGTTTLSLGLIVGLIAGMWIRYRDPLGFRAGTAAEIALHKPDPDDPETDPLRDGLVRLHGDDLKACSAVLARIDAGEYEAGDAAQHRIRDDLSDMAHRLCEHQP